MFQFLWPYALMAAPLPVLVAWLVPPARGAAGALRLPFFDAAQIWSEDAGLGGRGLRLALATVVWALLVAAACRPQWIGDEVGLPLTGRDMMLSVDVSGSMQVKDMVIERRTVQRLTAVKRIAGEFISRRHGDRVGLLLFGTRPYVMSPLTFDRETVRKLLEDSEVGLAGQKTAIGDSIGLALKQLRETESEGAPHIDAQRDPEAALRPATDGLENRVLVLLTDGANTTGEVEPREAAQLAAANGLKIYTIGIGAESMVVRRMFGTQRVNPSAELDEKTLNAIAEETGGQYFRARNAEDLERIYTLIDRLEPAASDEAIFRPVRELAHWPLGAAFALSLLMAVPSVVRELLAGARAPAAPSHIEHA